MIICATALTLILTHILKSFVILPVREHFKHWLLQHLKYPQPYNFQLALYFILYWNNYFCESTFVWQCVYDSAEDKSTQIYSISFDFHIQYILYVYISCRLSQDLPVVPDRKQRSENPVQLQSPAGQWRAAHPGCGSELWSLLRTRSHLLTRRGQDFYNKTGDWMHTLACGSCCKSDGEKVLRQWNVFNERVGKTFRNLRKI